jgi:hypothetical protein
MDIVTKSELAASDNVRVCVYDARTLRLLDRFSQHNLVTTAGKNLLRDFLNGDAPAGLTHFGLGTGSTAAALTDATLGTEVFRDLVTSRVKASGLLTVKYFLASTSANGNTLREAALFNAGASGTMFARVVLSSAIVKTSSVAVTFSWDLSWS